MPLISDHILDAYDDAMQLPHGLPRIPLLILSPYSTGGKIQHVYGDHVSLLKFIERNWRLPPITNRSRDNLPNPLSVASNPYVPTNMPSIDDLFDAFDFSKPPAAVNYLP